MKKYNKRLKFLLSHLPEKDPEYDVWLSIERQLKFEDKLGEYTNKLPLYDPDKELWKGIEAKLEKGKVGIKGGRAIVLLAAAASITIIIGVKLFISPKSLETVTVTEELVKEEVPQVKTIESDSLANKANDFIAEQCKSRSYICELPEFKERRQQLDEIDAKILEIDGIIIKTGSSPSLVQTRLRLENMRTQVFNKIIKIIVS